jgi:hypothetical protein
MSLLFCYIVRYISCHRIKQKHIIEEMRVILSTYNTTDCRSQWPRGLRRRSSAARLLRSWVRIPLKTWMLVCCECCVLQGRGLCDGLITRPEDSYRLWRFVVCVQETSKTRRLKSATGLWKIQPQWVVTPGQQTTKNTKPLTAWVTLGFLSQVSDRLY